MSTMSKSDPSEVSGFASGLAALMFLAAIGYGIYYVCDNAGWIPHDQTLNFYMKGDWLVGENRTCIGFQSYPNGKGEDPQLTSISCPETYALDETPHNMTVKFWGKVSRPDMMSQNLFLSWQCIRNSDGFVCKALN
jgi:hypothetical protein